MGDYELAGAIGGIGNLLENFANARSRREQMKFRREMSEKELKQRERRSLTMEQVQQAMMKQRERDMDLREKAFKSDEERRKEMKPLEMARIRAAIARDKAATPGFVERTTGRTVAGWADYGAGQTERAGRKELSAVQLEEAKLRLEGARREMASGDALRLLRNIEPAADAILKGTMTTHPLMQEYKRNVALSGIQERDIPMMANNPALLQQKPELAQLVQMWSKMNADMSRRPELLATLQKLEAQSLANPEEYRERLSQALQDKIDNPLVPDADKQQAIDDWEQMIQEDALMHPDMPVPPPPEEIRGQEAAQRLYKEAMAAKMATVKAQRGKDRGVEYRRALARRLVPSPESAGGRFITNLPEREPWRPEWLQQMLYGE